MADHEPHPRQHSDPDPYLSRLEENGRLLNVDNREYFEVGYGAVDDVFDPTLSMFENVTAALHARADRGDAFAPNQGGFVLGVLARAEELYGGQEL